MANLPELQSECVEAIRQYVDKANKRWPQLQLCYPRIRFNLTGSVAGLATWGTNLVELHNRFLLKDPTDYIPNTAGHEVAHLVARRLNVHKNIKSHGDEWQQVCWTFGIKAERCHRYNAVVPAAQQRARQGFKTENGVIRPISIGKIIEFD